jgi:integrase
LEALFGRACKKAHGSWVLVAELERTAGGKRKQVKRSGFPTKTATHEALTELLGQANKGKIAHDGQQTLADYLPDWIDTKEQQGLRASTIRTYRAHMVTYLSPELGHLRLREVRPGHVQAILLSVPGTKPGRRNVGPATVRRIHATLRSALSTAKRKRLIAYNPAADIELPKAVRPTVRPWEPEELGRFLDYSAADRVGGLYEIVALTGLQRGEICGLRWLDIDLTRRRLIVSQQLVQLGHEVLVGPIKTSAGQDRIVDLEETSVGSLLAARLRQDTERARWGDAWTYTGLVFTREDVRTLHPETVTKHFRRPALAAGLNHPGVSGDSTSWEGWSHGRKHKQEVPARAS